MGSRPKTPKPTKAEVALQQRQREESARLDDEENARFKRILSGQSGSRRLLSAVRRPVSNPSTLSAAMKAPTATSGGTSATPGGASTTGRMVMPRRPFRGGLLA